MTKQFFGTSRGFQIGDDYFLFGNGHPDSVLTGDVPAGAFYIDLTTGYYYRNEGSSGAPSFVNKRPVTAVLYGSGAPNDADGNPDDTYINELTGELYRKQDNNTWLFIADLYGADGLIYGDTAPASGTGTQGDTYIDRSTGNFYQKVDATTWNQIGTLQGNLFTGTSDPSDGIGFDGDTFYNFASGVIFKKVSGAWESQDDIGGDVRAPANTRADEVVVFNQDDDPQTRTTGVFISPQGNLYGAGAEVEVISATSLTLTASHNGKMLWFTSDTTVSVSLPDNSTEDLNSGFQAVLVQGGNGAVVFDTIGSDTIIPGAGNTSGKGSVASVVKKEDGLWLGTIPFNPNDYATAAQGSLADSALQPDQNLSDVSDVPTARNNLGLGSAALNDTGDFATAAQGSKADSALQSASNLGDLGSASSARSNLGLGSAALNDTGDFATAAQGSKADTALQPNNNLSDVQDASAARTNIGLDQVRNVASYSQSEADQRFAVLVQNNESAARAPTATDDSSAGYAVNSIWVDNTDPAHPEIYRCLDATAGSAVWVKTSLTIDELGSAALSDTSDFATAAQGSKADTALQPNQNLSELTDASVARSNLGLTGAATTAVQSSQTDTTAGSLMTVGAFGLGAVENNNIPNNDLNDITVAGFYSAVNSANRPPAGNGGVIHFSTNNTGSGYTEQLFITYGTSGNPATMYFRKKYSGSWGAWIKVFSETDIADQSTAEDGSDDSTVMTPLKVFQAFSQYGLGVNAPSVSDLDDVTEMTSLKTGFYSIQDGTVNRPFSKSSGGTLLVIKHSTDYFSLTASAVSDHLDVEVYERKYSARAGFTNWVRVLDNSQFASTTQAQDTSNTTNVMNPKSTFDSYSQFGLGVTDRIILSDLGYTDPTQVPTGFYGYNNSTTDKPFSSGAGVVIIQVVNPTNWTQIAMDYASSAIWFRLYNSGTYGNWIEIFHDGRIADTATAQAGTSDTTVSTPRAVADYVNQFGLGVVQGTGTTGTNLPTNDLNDITLSGFYSYVTASSVANVPSGAENGSVIHVPGSNSSNGYATQIYFNYNTSNRMWIRSKRNTIWTSWIEILTDQNTGDIVTHDVSEFATAAQGSTADSAIQPTNTEGDLTPSAPTEVTTDKTITAEDFKVPQRVTGAATITLPESTTENLPLGFTCDFQKATTATVGFAVEGTDTLESAAGTEIINQYGWVTAIKMADGVWAIVGDL